MPRRARLMLPNVPLHLIQRGNNRQACFFAHADYCVYLEWLGDYALGNERFAEQIATALARRVTPGIGGRPRKQDLSNS